MREVKATVSGSFRRHLTEIQQAVDSLAGLKVDVLSPRQPEVVDELDGFVFVASDQYRSVRLVQDRHMASIADSDFLWLVTPDGYVGQSASLELGFATATGIPVYSDSLPTDLTLRQYVQQVPNIAAAISLAKRVLPAKSADDLSILVEPADAANAAVVEVERLRSLLTRVTNMEESASLSDRIRSHRDRLARIIRLPTN